MFDSWNLQVFEVMFARSLSGITDQTKIRWLLFFLVQQWLQFTVIWETLDVEMGDGRRSWKWMEARYNIYKTDSFSPFPLQVSPPVTWAVSPLTLPFFCASRCNLCNGISVSVASPCGFHSPFANMKYILFNDLLVCCFSEYLSLQLSILEQYKLLQRTGMGDWVWRSRGQVTDLLEHTLLKDLSRYEDRPTDQIRCHEQAG